MVQKEGGFRPSVSYKRREEGISLLLSMWLLHNDISILLGKDVPVGMEKLVFGFSRYMIMALKFLSSL
jgi:hypothetical protein